MKGLKRLLENHHKNKFQSYREAIELRLLANFRAMKDVPTVQFEDLEEESESGDYDDDIVGGGDGKKYKEREHGDTSGGEDDREVGGIGIINHLQTFIKSDQRPS